MLLFGRHLSDGQDFRVERLKLLLERLDLISAGRLALPCAVSCDNCLEIDPIESSAERLYGSLDVTIDNVSYELGQ